MWTINGFEKQGNWETYGRRTIMEIILTTTTSIGYNKNNLYTRSTRNRQFKAQKGNKSTRNYTLWRLFFFIIEPFIIRQCLREQFFSLTVCIFHMCPFFAFAHIFYYVFFSCCCSEWNIQWKMVMNYQFCYENFRFSYPINLWFCVSCAQQDCRA